MVCIARLLRDQVKDVCTNVPASEGMEVPIRFDGGDLGVVSVEFQVCGTLEGSGDRVTD